MSHLNVCILTWDVKYDRIVKLKKKIVEFLASANTMHTEPIFKRLKQLKVNDILIMQELNFYYKFIHETLPSYLQNLPLYANTNTQDYAKRTNQNVHLEFIPNHEHAKMCVSYQVPNIVNSTAINIIEKKVIPIV